MEFIDIDLKKKPPRKLGKVVYIDRLLTGDLWCSLQCLCQMSLTSPSPTMYPRWYTSTL